MEGRGRATLSNVAPPCSGYALGMAHLRHIAVHVEEPKPGRFTWVLTERGDHEWQELDKSSSHAASYHQAMADGLLALQAIVPDLDVGPRSADEAATTQAHATPSDQQADRASRRRAGGAKRVLAVGKSYFGFGPAR